MVTAGKDKNKSMKINMVFFILFLFSIACNNAEVNNSTEGFWQSDSTSSINSVSDNLVEEIFQEIGIYSESDSIVLFELVPILEKVQYIPENNKWLFKEVSRKDILKISKKKFPSLQRVEKIYRIELVNGKNRLMLYEWIFNSKWSNLNSKDVIDFMYSTVGEGDFLSDSEFMFNYQNRMIRVLNLTEGEESIEEAKLLKERIEFFLDSEFYKENK